MPEYGRSALFFPRRKTFHLPPEFSSPHHTCPSPCLQPDPAFRELITSPSELLVEGKDTCRYHNAGAAQVAWLRSGPDGLGDGLKEALPQFETFPGVVVEGNSHTFHHKPDRMILVARTSLSEIKPTAKILLPGADLVILNDDGRASDPLQMSAERLEAAGAEGTVLSGDISCPEFGLVLQARILTWFPPLS
jgi:hypothetical protein